MKKYIYFIFICTLGLGFVGCGDDDEEPLTEFKWNGDWNDENDLNYKPEGYNPIEGLWRSQDDKSKGYFFGESRSAWTATFNENGTVDRIRISPNEGYIINNTGVKIKDEIWAYKVDATGKILSLAFPLDYNKWTYYEWISENPSYWK